MTTIERLQTSLTSLGLKAVEPRLENLLEQASNEAPSYADFLDQFLCEVEARRTRYLRALATRAPAVLEDLRPVRLPIPAGHRRAADPGVAHALVVHEASNVIFLGPPGVGKTHLSVALAEAAIQSGFGAYFMTAHELVTDLARAYREGRLDRRMRVYLASKVLVIDEMGYVPLDDIGATIFFQTVSARYMSGAASC